MGMIIRLAQIMFFILNSILRIRDFPDGLIGSALRAPKNDILPPMPFR